MDLNIKIDNSRCKKCGICKKICAAHISLEKRVEHGFINEECSRCLHCYALCPNNAIKIEGIKNTGSINTNGKHQIQESQLVDFLANRRSHRRFKEREIEKEIIDRLISSAGLIPSGGNSHPYDFTIINKGDIRDLMISEIRNSYELKRKILKNQLLRKALYLFSDSQIKGFLKDRIYLKRVTGLLDQLNSGEEVIFYNAPAVIIIHSDKKIPTPKEDCVLAAYNIVLVAGTIGLGTCIVTLAQNGINENKRCKAIIGLSSRDDVHAVVAIGYPEKRFLRPVPKIPKPVCRV